MKRGNACQDIPQCPTLKWPMTTGGENDEGDIGAVGVQTWALLRPLAGGFTHPLRGREKREPLSEGKKRTFFHTAPTPHCHNTSLNPGELCPTSILQTGLEPTDIPSDRVRFSPARPKKVAEWRCLEQGSVVPSPGRGLFYGPTAGTPTLCLTVISQLLFRSPTSP